MPDLLDFLTTFSEKMGVCVMEHSTTQALVMEPPYIPFVKNSGKHCEKQENIDHMSELIWYLVL